MPKGPARFLVFIAIELLLVGWTVWRLPAPRAIAQDFGGAGEKTRLKRILAILDEDPRDIRVCEQLAGPREGFGTTASASYTIEDFLGADRSDSILEASRIPIRAFFQEPLVAGLIREVEASGALTGEKTEAAWIGFLEKAGFYARVARAGVSFITDKAKFERLGDRANHLGVLAKFARVEPKLRDDAGLRDLCRTIQAAGSVGTADGLRAERKEILAFLAERGLDPARVEFNPEVWTRFALKFQDRRLTLSVEGKDPPVDDVKN